MTNNQAVINSTYIQKQASQIILTDFSNILFKINSVESGRIAETCLQLLSDQTFQLLAFFIIERESEELAKELVSEIVFAIYNKLGLEFDTVDPISDATINIMTLINYENLRRKGTLDYTFQDNIFTSTPKYAGFTKLTQHGEQIALDQVLFFHTGTIQ